MKLSLLQEALFEKLNLASRFVSSKAQLPILLNFLLSAKEGKLKIAATNLESGISTTVGAKVEKEGEITVPARIFLDLISTLSPGKITLEEENGQLKISSISFSGTLSSLPATEFPQIPDVLSENPFLLDRKTIEVLSRKISFAAAQDETRPVLTGILLILGEKSLAVATDGFRLSYSELDIKAKQKNKINILIPAKIINELEKINTEDQAVFEVSVLQEQGQLIFRTDETILTARFIEGDFPPYEKVIPTSWNTRLVCGREDLARAVRTASVFARDGNIVKIKAEDGKIILSSESNQYGKEEISIEAKTEGEKVETAFNYKFLMDFVASIDGETISIETQGPTSPAVFQDVKDTLYKHIIMPVMLQEANE